MNKKHLILKFYPKYAINPPNHVQTSIGFSIENSHAYCRLLLQKTCPFHPQGKSWFQLNKFP